MNQGVLPKNKNKNFMSNFELCCEFTIHMSSLDNICNTTDHVTSKLFYTSLFPIPNYKPII